MGASKAAKPRAMDALQRGVLASTPAAANRLRYLGGADLAFGDACRARNPHVEILDADDTSAVEALAADDLTVFLARPDAATLLATTETLVAAIPAAATDVNAPLRDLVDHGFELARLQPLTEAAAYFNDIADDLVATWRVGGLTPIPGRALLVVARRAGAQPPAMLISMFTFAPTLMDIRTRLPAMALRTEPDLLIQHQRPPGQLPVGPPDQPKILVIQRPAPPEDLEAWRSGMVRRVQDGWIAVVEFDDHPVLTARVKGREVAEADWLRFTCTHAVQTSTPPLLDLFRTLNPETRMFTNAVFQLEKFPENLPKRVFYGAVQRGPHSVDVARALEPAIQRFPGVEFVVVGDRDVFNALPTARKRYHDLVPYDEYLKLMGACAVSLSPIEDTEVNAAKSDAKFLDAAARGVLTIASPTIYGAVIRHGETGLIAERMEDWADLLATALGDDAARREMARNAWSYVRDHRMFASQIRERNAWYRDLWARRAELNRALFARMQR